MKATGIVRRIDDLGRVVIPKEIRRTMRIREGDPSQMTLEQWEKFCFAMLALSKRWGWMIHNNEKLRLVGNFFASISVEGFEEANDGRRGQGHDAPKGGAVSRKSVGIG